MMSEWLMHAWGFRYGVGVLMAASIWSLLQNRAFMCRITGHRWRMGRPIMPGPAMWCERCSAFEPWPKPPHLNGQG
jgi:hypothetical protein